MIKERIIKTLEYKGIPKEEFYKKIGMTSASFRGKAKTTPLNSSAIENILSEIPDINIEWLITGKGEMLLSEENTLSSIIMNEDKGLYSSDSPGEEINVKIILEVNGNTKERILKLLGSNPDLDFLK